MVNMEIATYVLLKIFKMKKNEKLNENIKTLENLSKDLPNSLEEIKKTFEKISEYKDKLKLNIQKIFTELRNKINNREDQILAKIERIFNKILKKNF